MQSGRIAPTVDITVVVKGGGVTGQTDAVQLGVARALVKMNSELIPTHAQGRFHDPRRAREGTQKAWSETRPQGPDVHQTLIFITIL